MSFSTFSHVTAEKSALYRAVMAVFVEAKSHFVVHLRPEDVAERLTTVTFDEIQATLAQLTAWGNIQAEHDTGRVTTVEEFHRARFLYQITREGEAAELALQTFEEAIGRRGALQSVALRDIQIRLRALQELAAQPAPDEAQVAAALRDLAHVFADLAENARAFMTGLGRTFELRGTDREAFLAYKDRLIDYLDRFIGDLVVSTGEIASLLAALESPKQGFPVDRLLHLMAAREAQDLAPAMETGDPEAARRRALSEALLRWHGHWEGLRAWFIGRPDHPSQATVLRNRARRAISQLLEAVMRINERRLGRSDRSADFRTLARWFMECDDDAGAHRLWRAAFALAPARHLTIDEETLAAWESRSPTAATPWRDAPPLQINPRLRTTGSYEKRGAPAKVVNRDQARRLLAAHLADEAAEVRAARTRLATGQPIRLSALGDLDKAGFRLFLQCLGEALAAAEGVDAVIRTVTGDGSLAIELKPLGPDTRAVIATPGGSFSGRDYELCITDLEAT